VPLFQPARLALVLIVLSTRMAHAVQPPVLGRQVTLPGAPDEPPPVVRMGLGVATTLLFDAPIVLASVQVDETLVKVLDGGEHSLILALLRAPATHEQPGLRVRYADSDSPGWATFTLLAPSTEVDTLLQVRRRPQPLEACQAELARTRARCDGSSAEVWVLARRLGKAGVTSTRLLPSADKRAAQSGLSVKWGLLHRAETFWLLVLTLDNAAGQEPWAPTEATLTPLSPGGSKAALAPAVAVRTVSLEEGALAPGSRGRLAVETEPPAAAAAGRYFLLTVRGTGGLQLTYEVFLPMSETMGDRP
jgi:uncharacterized protein (TIGR02268 family)